MTYIDAASSDLLSTVSAFFIWGTRYTTENKHLLTIYAIVNQVKLHPKETISMFVT